MLEHHAKALPRDLVRGKAGDFSPCKTTSPADGRSMPITLFIAVDLPDPFGPIRPNISPG